jgi:lipopolysaccharide transport system ATP-binding protein
MSYNWKKEEFDLSEDTLISIRGISKCYQKFEKPQDRLKQLLAGRRKQYYTEFWALRDINIEIKRGETVGIIGRNGSGKSTLLQIIAGTLAPTTGDVIVRGRVSALLELGSGFNPEYTGRENVFMNGAILGLSYKEMEERFDEIASFADIGEFIDQPVKTYSSGMFVRLAFAVAVNVQPQILLVDEALAVGDLLFQKRCHLKIKEMREQGVTILYVGHDMETIRTLCNKAYLLSNGQVIASGDPAKVVLEYRKRVHEEEAAYFTRTLRADQRRQQAEHERQTQELQEAQGVDKASGRVEQGPSAGRQEEQGFGHRTAEILSVEVLDEQFMPKNYFYPGDTVKIRMIAALRENDANLNFGLRLRNKEGVKIYSWGMLNQDISIWSSELQGETGWEKSYQKGDRIECVFSFTCNLGMNLYEVTAMITREHDRYYKHQEVIHWVEEVAHFQVGLKPTEHYFGGVVDLNMRVDILNTTRNERVAYAEG